MSCPLVRDDPAEAAKRRDRKQDRRANGHYTPGAQPLKKRHYRSQQKRQN